MIQIHHARFDQVLCLFDTPLSWYVCFVFSSALSHSTHSSCALPSSPSPRSLTTVLFSSSSRSSCAFTSFFCFSRASRAPFSSSRSSLSLSSSRASRTLLSASRSSLSLSSSRASRALLSASLSLSSSLLLSFPSPSPTASCYSPLLPSARPPSRDCSSSSLSLHSSSACSSCFFSSSLSISGYSRFHSSSSTQSAYFMMELGSLCRSLSNLNISSFSSLCCPFLRCRSSPGMRRSSSAASSSSGSDVAWGMSHRPPC